MAKTDKEILSALDRIEKLFGEGTVVGGDSARIKRDVISTGSIGLDSATGIGGFALGSVVEIMGWESSGKSTITLNVMASAQKQGLNCVLVDGENSFDAKYAKILGVSVEDLYVIQMDSGGGEKCYNAAEELVRTGKIGVVVFDSQTSLLPKKVIEDPTGTVSMGLHARMLSLSIPKFVTLAAQHGCLVIYVSQFREKIGVIYGSPVTTNGGNALKFYAHMRVEVSKIVQKVDEVAHHNKTKCRVVKNKLAAPFGEAEFDIIFGEGIDRNGEIIDIGVELEIVKQSGSWYKYNENKLGQGRENVKNLLKDNPDLAEKIYDEIRKRQAAVPTDMEKN